MDLEGNSKYSEDDSYPDSKEDLLQQLEHKRQAIKGLPYQALLAPPGSLLAQYIP